LNLPHDAPSAGASPRRSFLNTMDETELSQSPPALPQQQPPAEAGPRCAQHSTVPALYQCDSCGAFICATCVFDADGGGHVCPTCATRPRDKIGSKRKQSMIWGYVLAVVATLSIVGLRSGVISYMASTPQDFNEIALLFSFGTLIPSVAGLAVSFGALDRRLQNPFALKFVAGWNAVILAIYILLVALNAFSSS
jgi:hypothetical protein